MPAFDYAPDGATLKAFLRSQAFVRGIRGPIGSGKSVECAVEILRRTLEEWPKDRSKPPAAGNPRRARWAVIRNTAPELKTTTIKTWLDWFPEEDFGKFNWSPPYTHHIQRYGIDLEVIFLALDRPDDVKKLLSLELTGCWINEAREVPKEIIDGATSRVGRFPSMRDGGSKWAGVIMDTNSPDDDHWWPLLSGEAPPPEWMDEDELLMLVKPDNWQFFTQPPAMAEVYEGVGKHRKLIGYRLNEQGENHKYLRPDYYDNLIRGKSKTWINIYVMNRLGAIEDGKPIYDQYSPEIHAPDEDFDPVEGLPVYLGQDYGLTPATVFAQRVNGRWVIQFEICSKDMGAKRHGALVKQLLAEHYPWTLTTPETAKRLLHGTGDPAGDIRVQTDEETPFMVMRALGLPVYPATSNDLSLRIDAVNEVFAKLVEGRPAILIAKRCKVLRKACGGGYQYRRIQVLGSAPRFEEKPNKNRYSHVAEALQYMLLGGGEGRALVHAGQASKPVVAKRAGSPFERLRSRR
ncbi:hypothetical protein [Azospirillum sp. sgz301742]